VEGTNGVDVPLQDINMKNIIVKDRDGRNLGIRVS
jgi:hypothetical protein